MKNTVFHLRQTSHDDSRPVTLTDQRSKRRQLVRVIRVSTRIFVTFFLLPKRRFRKTLVPAHSLPQQMKPFPIDVDFRIRLGVHRRRLVDFRKHVSRFVVLIPRRVRERVAHDDGFVPEFVLQSLLVRSVLVVRFIININIIIIFFFSYLSVFFVHRHRRITIYHVFNLLLPLHLAHRLPRDLLRDHARLQALPVQSV